MLCGGRLMQQYVVDMYAKIEQLRLNFIRNNQKQLRAELYEGLYDAILRGDAQSTGKRIILPATFHGGPDICINDIKMLWLLLEFMVSQHCL